MWKMGRWKLDGLYQSGRWWYVSGKHVYGCGIAALFGGSRLLLLSPLFLTVGDIRVAATRGLRFNQQRHFLQCTICGVNATCGIKCRAICGIHATCGIRSSRCAMCHLRHLPPAAVSPLDQGLSATAATSAVPAGFRHLWDITGS